MSIYDRGFASIGLMYLLNKADKHFLVRAKLSFNKEVKAFVKSKKYSKIVEIPLTDNAKKLIKEQGESYDAKQTVRVRLVKVILDTGEVEVFITSLVEVFITSLLDTQAYRVNEFKDLCFKRSQIIEE